MICIWFISCSWSGSRDAAAPQSAGVPLRNQELHPPPLLSFFQTFASWITTPSFPVCRMGTSLSRLAAFQSLHIVMLGLDSAGKTTVLYRLKFNEFVNTVPTIGFNTERIRLGGPGASRGISCHFWDVGGQEKLRPLWKPYSRCTDGIVYVVDSVDAERLEEARAELHRITRFQENQGTPLLVIANKQDLPRALDVENIERQLALSELSPSTPYHVQPACAIIGEGLDEGMDKLYEMIVKRRKTLKQRKKKQ
ncbi:ADP-ribosylation factor-like protein 4C [Ilyodon furcidens]|uniref:ADP-ribosylation factor-like protein 4C n=5 Tax=Goodeidae TaxID=28758 RepID=A0ABV0UQ14_9TELE